jgi:tripeptide aminopeptidase
MKYACDFHCLPLRLLNINPYTGDQYIMSVLLDRFIRYAKIDTRSNEETADHTPSTENQWELARLLEQELKDIGLKNVRLNEKCFLTAELPSNSSKNLPTIGFLAHMDTTPDFIGKGVNPQIIENYDGKDIPLKGKSGMVLSPVEFPELLECVGKTLITTDGTTLLGADDKAGVAEIMTAMEHLVTHPEIEHGTIRIGFTPDEETGVGIMHFDVPAFNADFAYTLDGGKAGEIEYENFNAAKAHVHVHGKSVHPGSAKNIMKNAMHIFYEFDSLLPAEQRPEHTEGREGFFHLLKMSSGTVEEVTAGYIVRDHNPVLFEKRKQLMRESAHFINSKYGEGTLDLTITEQYKNMSEVIQPVMHIVETAQEAMRSLDIEPITTPIRGGTDGARLSYMGLPTPNIFTGGMNFHGPYEYACLESMEKAVQVILKIIDLYVN